MKIKDACVMHAQKNTNVGKRCSCPWSILREPAYVGIQVRTLRIAGNQRFGKNYKYFSFFNNRAFQPTQCIGMADSLLFQAQAVLQQYFREANAQLRAHPRHKPLPDTWPSLMSSASYQAWIP